MNQKTVLKASRVALAPPRVEPSPSVALYDAATDAVDTLTRCLRPAAFDPVLTQEIQAVLQGLTIAIDRVNGSRKP